MGKKKSPEMKKGRGSLTTPATSTIPNNTKEGTVFMNTTTLAAVSHDALTMSSREIAELTGKQHNNVMRDIRVMMEALEQDSNLSSVCKQTTYSASNGQKYPQYELDKDTCLTLLLGYDPVARMKVVKRWQELEGRQPDPAALLNDPAALRGLLIGYTEKVEVLEHKIEADAPKVAFAERHERAEGWFCIRDAAKIIGIPERQFINRLLMNGYVYRAQGNGRLVPYAETIKRGYMDVKTHTVMREDGTEKATQQAMVLTRGIQHFQNKYQEVAA